MKQFSIELRKNVLRPIIKLYGMQALIDTGAVWPVFSFSDTDMKAIFGATKLNEGAKMVHHST